MAQDTGSSEVTPPGNVSSSAVAVSKRTQLFISLLDDDSEGEHVSADHIMININ